jgi:2-polyprenyl-6-methoxyphenol hydroxylase-like FAD-dependent oxidoreductase
VIGRPVPGPTGDIEIDRVDVVVVGGGPVGLAMALDLGTRGVRVLVVDASPGIVDYPTAESIDVRTMEWLRQRGLAGAVRHSGFPDTYPRDIAFVTTLSGHELARFPRPDNAHRFAATAGLSPEGSVWWPKFWFDTALRDAVSALPNVTLRYRWRCDSISQTGDDVAVNLVGTDGTQRVVRAQYLVGCDGGRSTVRRQCGIAMEGSAREARWQGALVEIPGLLAAIDLLPAVQYYLLRPRRLILGSLDGDAFWRVTYPLADGEEPTRDEVLDTVLAGIGRTDLAVTIHDTRPWAGHTIVAQSYRSGRVLLAGDSAHQMWPSGGHGMNTGIGDVANLGWKLALAVRGAAGPGLLDSYQAERKPVALRNTARAAHNYAADLALPTEPALDAVGAAGEQAREAAAGEIRRTREAEWRSLGVQLGYRYTESPVILDDATEPPADQPSVYLPVVRPGHRAPHVWLDDGRSTVDLFTDDHVLLRSDPALAVDGWVEQFAARGSTLRVVDLGRPGVGSGSGYASAGLVLVRPDGVVAWRGLPADAGPADVADVVLGFGPRTASATTVPAMTSGDPGC